MLLRWEALSVLLDQHLPATRILLEILVTSKSIFERVGERGEEATVVVSLKYGSGRISKSPSPPRASIGTAKPVRPLASREPDMRLEKTSDGSRDKEFTQYPSRTGQQSQAWLSENGGFALILIIWDHKRGTLKLYLFYTILITAVWMNWSNKFRGPWSLALRGRI